MDTKRMKFYCSKLKSLSSENDFVIFENPRTENFIQFAWESKNKYLLDIPTQKLESIHPSEDVILNKIKGLDDSRVDSLQKICDIEEAINAIKLFFKDICLLPNNFKLRVILNSNGVEKTSFIGEEDQKTKIDFLFLDLVVENITIVKAKNIKKAKEKYSLYHLNVDDSLKWDIKNKNVDSQFWEEFIYYSNNDDEILEKLQDTFGIREGEELLKYYNDKDMHFNDLSNDTKKNLALKDIENGISEGTILVKPYFQINVIS